MTIILKIKQHIEESLANDFKFKMKRNTVWLGNPIRI